MSINFSKILLDIPPNVRVVRYIPYPNIKYGSDKRGRVVGGARSCAWDHFLSNMHVWGVGPLSHVPQKKDTNDRQDGIRANIM